MQEEMDPILNEKSLVGGCDWSIYTSVTQGLPKARERHWATWAFARSATGRQIGTLRRCHWYTKAEGYIWLKPLHQNPPSVRSVFTWKGKQQECVSDGHIDFFVWRRRRDMHLNCISSTIVKWKCMRGILRFQTSDTVAIVAKNPSTPLFTAAPVSWLSRVSVFSIMNFFLTPFSRLLEKPVGLMSKMYVTGLSNSIPLCNNTTRLLVQSIYLSWPLSF